MSSSGVFVESPSQVRTGARLELKIELPIRHGQIARQIVAFGTILRREESGFAVLVARYQYRTVQKFGEAGAISGRVPFERRSRARFPLELRVNFRSLNRRSSFEGAGWIANISSSGVLVQSPSGVRVGARLELKIELPMRLDGLIALQLVARGRIVRCEGSRFAVSVTRYQFRTMSGWPQRFAAQSAGGISPSRKFGS
jgi:hypothetical protein